MSNYFKLSMLALAVAGLTACSSDIDDPVANGDGTVNLSIQLPSDINTRNAFGDQQYGDGTTVDDLVYAVYEVNGGVPDATPLYKKTVSSGFFSGATQSGVLTLKLVQGKSYQVVCWAQSPAAADKYEFNDQTKSITVKYDTNGESLDHEAYDAFYGSKIVNTVDANQSIELVRPFAQINLGADDAMHQAVTKAYGSTIKTEASLDVCSTLDLVTGKTDGVTKIKYTMTERPAEKYTFPVNPATKDAATGEWSEGNHYVHMVYALVPNGGKNGTENTAGRSTLDMEYTFYSSTGEKIHSRTVPQVPVQTNYRTNIFGSLFTTNTELTITINPIFAGDHNYPQPVASVDDLKNALQDGSSVILTQDLDLTTADGSVTKIGKDGVKSIVDLDGHTLTVGSPLVINSKGNVIISNGKIVNNTADKVPFRFNTNESDNASLTLENVNLTSAYAAIMTRANNVNITIKGSHIKGGAHVVSTNATNSNGPVNFVFENSTFELANPDLTDADNLHNAAFLCNVAASIKANNCSFIAPLHPAIVRCGEAEFENCTFNATFKDVPATLDWAQYLNGNWGTGGNVAVAALTVGNKNNAAYKPGASADLKNCTLIVPDAYAANCPSIYAYGFSEDYKAIVKYDAATETNSTNWRVLAGNTNASISK